MMSSEVFENREDDFKHLFAELRKKLNQQFPKSSGESRKRLTREIERGLEEANILIQEMEEEARKAPASYRMNMVSGVRNHRRDADQLSRDLRRANNDFGGQPSVSGFYDDDDFDGVEDSQRAQLLQGTGSLTRASQSLARTHQVAAETDQIGVEIIDELGQQRESLVRTRDRLHDTDSNLSRSRKILNTMAKRVMTNKLILAVIILLELGILGGVVYWKFFLK